MSNAATVARAAPIRSRPEPRCDWQGAVSALRLPFLAEKVRGMGDPDPAFLKVSSVPSLLLERKKKERGPRCF